MIHLFLRANISLSLSYSERLLEKQKRLQWERKGVGNIWNKLSSPQTFPTVHLEFKMKWCE